MELSVVVSTLNDRERLVGCLDSIRRVVPPSTELVVVNGPSSDGTSGLVRDRDDVDVLVEISERTRTVSRNAGIEVATGDVVAFLSGSVTVEDSWYDALSASASAGSGVLTGPVEEATRSPATRRLASRSRVATIDGDNLAVERTVLDDLDGFDEYLPTAGAVDFAHRLAASKVSVSRVEDMQIRRPEPVDESTDPDWGQLYRAQSYLLTKNYGIRPHVCWRLVGGALRDGAGGLGRILRRNVVATRWIANGVGVVRNLCRGFVDGLRARYADQTRRRNPHGVSTRLDRAVRREDRRT